METGYVVKFKSLVSLLIVTLKVITFLSFLSVTILSILFPSNLNSTSYSPILVGKTVSPRK